ncbi:dienelactone hydrolase [Aureobasidium pullulans]|nr:dienelactone hydrolase [Aureobasidium pullulans]
MSDKLDPMLAKPADLCCLKGSFHSGEPQGKTVHIEGVETYIATPAPDTANGNILLYLPDAFGLLGNSFLLMDAFASCGYLTLGVDCFLGDAVSKHTTTPLSDPKFDFEAWCDKHLKSSEEVAAKWVKAVKSRYSTSDSVKFACVGYCWGARIVCQQLSKDGVCKAGAIAHPSFMKESHVFGVDGDLFLPESRARTVEILTEGEKKFNMQVYSGVGHGFATRPDMSDPYQKWAKEQCFKGFVEWFDFWLSRD